MTVKVDKYDIAILDTLQNEGRITKLELAERIGLSQTPCHERVKRMERTGLIRSYHACVNISSLVDLSFVFVTVILERHKALDFRRFETAITQIPQIIECFSLGGGLDYLMKVVIRDLKEYQTLMDSLLDSELGIAQYYTYVVTKAVKHTPSLPLKQLLGDD